VQQYLNASDSYFNRKRQGRAVSMDFPFPAIFDACPVCQTACGAIYRGYYRRWVICPQALFMGWVAIRTGLCKAKKRRFALFPSFLVPFRSFSRIALLWLWGAWNKTPCALVQSVDRWFNRMEREVYISVSTIYLQLRLIVRQLQAGHLLFGVKHFTPATLSGALDLNLPEVESAILHPAFGLAASLRIDPPP
jgi:hypothetical protein